MITSLHDPDVIAAFKPQPHTVQVGSTSIAKPFPSPADWRSLWIYFLLVDRFNNPSAPPKGTDPYLPYQGGNFAGIKAKLSYLRDLGVGAIWLSPVQMNPWWFRDYYAGYAIQDLIRVEPRFCADPEAAHANPAIARAELQDLVDAAHAQGIYVIFDIVLNHMGNLFVYDGGASERDWNPGGEYPIRWRGTDGQPQPVWSELSKAVEDGDVGPWPVELRHDEYFRRRGKHTESDVAHGDFGGGLKELVTEYHDDNAPNGPYPVRDIIIKAYQYLIAEYDIDGYRIDTLMYVERDFARVFGNAMREFAHTLGKHNFFTFGEIWQDDDESRIAEFVGRDSGRDDELVGVDAALDFPVRKRLVEVCKGRMPPEALARWFDGRREAQRRIVSSHGDASRYFVTFLENHDLCERLHWAPLPEQTTLALACLFTLQGIPCLYYGIEQGLDGRGGSREAVREALWSHGNPPFNSIHTIYQALQQLTALRRREPALCYGRQYFRELSGDGNHFGYSPYPGGVLAYSRILNDRELVIVANTGTSQAADLLVNVDRRLTPPASTLRVLWSNLASPQAPGTVEWAADRAVTRVHLRPMEVQVLAA